MHNQDVNRVAKTVWNLDINGARPHDRPKTRYINTVKEDINEVGLTKNDIMNRTK